MTGLTPCGRGTLRGQSDRVFVLPVTQPPIGSHHGDIGLYWNSSYLRLGNFLLTSFYAIAASLLSIQALFSVASSNVIYFNMRVVHVLNAVQKVVGRRVSCTV